MYVFMNVCVGLHAKVIFLEFGLETPLPLSQTLYGLYAGRSVS